MTAAPSLGPRRPARTRQAPIGYQRPVVFSRYPLRSECTRTIVGFPAKNDLAPAIRLAVVRPEGVRIGTITLYGAELLDMSERALEAAQEGRAEEIGDAASGRSRLRIWTHQHPDSVAIYFMRVRANGREASKRPMRLEPDEFDAFERALAWLRNETT